MDILLATIYRPVFGTFFVKMNPTVAIAKVANTFARKFMTFYFATEMKIINGKHVVDDGLNECRKASYLLKK